MNKLNTLNLDLYKSINPNNPNRSSGTALGEENFLILQCRIKWFKASDGYGFAQVIEDAVIDWLTTDDDIFIHSSKFDLTQMQSIKPGDIIKCKVVKGLRGPQVEEVYEFSSTEEKRGYVKGFIKWFDVQKGFGFVLSDPTQTDPQLKGRDVFLAGTRAKQLGINCSRLKMNTLVVFTYKVDAMRNQLIVDQMQLIEDK